MHKLSVAFVWHQHQPYYPDDLTGHNPMPWVRLHGTKDYWGMAMHLKEVPEMRATINFVPSLLAQIRAYTDDGAQDEHLRVSRLPADGLSETDRLYLLDNFFMVDADRMIRPHPRYFELYQQRGITVDDAARASRRFSSQDILDLQCWNNLVWMHPIAFEVDADLAEFRTKGQHWTEDEKQWLLDKQMELLRQVIPLHRALAKGGQLELTTTPFYHPILPLLVDKHLAREAMPDAPLPHRLESYAEDAAEQVRRAVLYHAGVFGSPPRGMWPSEGSVAGAIVPILAEAGIRWIATDEEILARSTDAGVTRDNQGLVRNPHMLYRPWRVEQDGAELDIIFRDHALSDHIGFHYQRYEAKNAVDDLFGKLDAIHRSASSRDSSRPPLVSIILDGENCWEYYPNSGVDFLRALYRRVASGGQVRPTRVSDFLDKYPPSDSLDRLFAGSWIGHNFGIWIGHQACNRAWDLLSETREMLVEVAAEETVRAAEMARAWDELYIAEGSDWFWWFDPNRSSSQDALFDQLFRKHLQNVYALVGREPPAELLRPIAVADRHLRPFTQPTGLLSVKLNGRETYFEWINAGAYLPSTARGTMTMAESQRVERHLFGFDEERLLLRFDTQGPVRQRLTDIETLRVKFVDPAGFELLVSSPAEKRPLAQLFHSNVPVSNKQIAAAADVILEIAVPCRALGKAADEPLHYFCELLAKDEVIERVPLEGVIETAVPSPDYELMMWQA
jgi:alpha-amylase/alpha-mannosidase (GH57 family)